MLRLGELLKSAVAAPHLEGRAVLLLCEVCQPHIQHPPVLRCTVPATCLAEPAGSRDRRCLHLASNASHLYLSSGCFVTYLSCRMGNFERTGCFGKTYRAAGTNTIPGPHAEVPDLLPGDPCWCITKLTITAAEAGPPAHLAWLRQPSASARWLTSRRHSAAASCCRPFPARVDWCTLGSTGSQYETRTL